MQTFQLSVILALVASAAVDSTELVGSRSVGQGDLWQYGGTGGHMLLGIHDRAIDWNQAGGVGDYHHHEQLQLHPVHEWHQDEHQHSSVQRDFQEWKPTYSAHGAESVHPEVSSKEGAEQFEEIDKHDDKHQHHHHHHHVKVVEVPKPFPVHVEKPYPVYVEKPVIVEKHVPLKLYIKKKYH
ncbi:uncharacterized protein LOC129725312 [Wyeomyia smithii]|uniref:uncharacterized protein LOC129725312 n=1 Tax=Wyeomyia smithii TaxID=174621 RepID=UPI0024681E89|nr:uncharacterized protein LOC129725312 [Wyeomyia smithii]